MNLSGMRFFATFLIVLAATAFCVFAIMYSFTHTGNSISQTNLVAMTAGLSLFVGTLVILFRAPGNKADPK